MSSSRRRRTLKLGHVVRVGSIAAIAACAAACASTPPKDPSASPRAGLTTTEQFTAKVTKTPDQILLAPHADGLSAAQIAALTDLVDRWRNAGAGSLLIQAPSHGGGSAFRTATAVQLQFESLGVPENSIRLEGYTGADHPGAPIVVAFDRYEAKALACGRDWQSFTRSASNDPNSNFGCAVTANMAALVANPADLVTPRASDPADAQRREAVITKYRAGAITSTAHDDQADAAISDVAH